MRFLPVSRLALVPALLVAAGTVPAFADAVTYAGTLGKLRIILELASAPEDGPVAAGRYAYLSRGADIPLHGLGKGKSLRFGEERPCTEEICALPEGDAAAKPPIGAEWSLTASADGGLSGTWTDKTSGKSLAVALERKATRAIDTTNFSALEGLDPVNSIVQYDTSGSFPKFLSPDELPYDFLKIGAPLETGKERAIGEARYRMDEDARVGLSYPLVTALGGADTSAVNASLTQQRLQFEMPAFACLSKAYLGTGWSGNPGDGTTGYDGGATVTVDHLTPRLMALTEGGSYDCGGAHPDNFTTHRIVDVETGEVSNPEQLLAGWQAIGRDGTPVDRDTYDNDDESLTYAPTEALVAYVRSHRRTFDADTEADCGIDDLLAGNLGVYVTRNSLVFTLRELPHVLFACTDDLFEVPLEDARPLLTEKAARYFEALDE